MRIRVVGNALKRFILCLAVALPLALPHVAVAGEQAPAATLLFFLNPNGQPCQVQSQIIDGIRPQIEQKARIVAVSTADSASMSRFRQYGVRYLPLLILVGDDQKEIKRFSPGIQPAEEILKEIAALGGKTS
ncbi:conjugal transfer protein TraF [Blastochloris viridis]|uniref:Thioredoxin domain-containing protein n=1 Tax=Blastochloris viridis TaxID=1079 RepID=A0A182D1R2_BLAVI|nr:conjugal transfer protein TraF [Blastochloris viridis]ALK10672.1 hypothetical protein BVIR_2909 [Blastochloris viridis]BAR99365.1 hypothetical protein BV133_1772 [Blastochloris viridis]